MVNPLTYVVFTYRFIVLYKDILFCIFGDIYNILIYPLFNKVTLLFNKIYNGQSLN